MKINKKVIYITGAVILLVVMVVIFIMLKPGSQGGATVDQISQAELQKTKDKQLYEDYQNNLALVYAKNIDKCNELGKADKINECVNDIAVSSKRKDYCEKITDAKLKNECLDSIDYMNYSWGNDPNLCDNLSNATHKDNCYNEYFIKLVNPDECNSVKDETLKTQCRDTVNNRLGTVLNQPEACESIMDNILKQACKANKTVPLEDSDNDGLPNDLEMSFGLSPFQADTDSDGVSDYDEINKNHTNPLVKN